MKINHFRGDLTDILVKKKTLLCADTLVWTAHRCLFHPTYWLAEVSLRIRFLASQLIQRLQNSSQQGKHMAHLLWVKCVERPLNTFRVGLTSMFSTLLAAQYGHWPVSFFYKTLHHIADSLSTLRIFTLLQNPLLIYTALELFRCFA